MHAAWAGVVVAEHAWLDDPTAALSYPAVKQRHFTPYHGVLNLGYTRSAQWIRVRIVPTGELTETNWIMRIRPTYLDDIQLFDPLAPANRHKGITIPQSSGDLHDWQTTGYRSLNHGFIIPVSPYPRDLYFRLKSTSTHLIYIEAMTHAQITAADRQQELLYDAYLATLLVFLGIPLAYWLTRREQLIGFFIIKQLVVLMHALALLGYIRIISSGLISPAGQDKITSFFVILFVGVSIAFELSLLREFRPGIKKMGLLSTALMLPWLLAMLFFLFGLDRQGLHLNTVVAGFAPPCFIYLAWNGRVWATASPEHPPLLTRRSLILFHIGILLATYIAILPNLGLLKAPDWGLNAPIATSFLTGMVILLLLMMRERNRDLAHQQVLLSLKLTEQRAAQEKQRREEQEQFLDMLTHELRSPVSVVGMSLHAMKINNPASQRIHRALGNINAVIERCKISGELDQQRLTPQYQLINTAETLYECTENTATPDRIRVSIEDAPAEIVTDPQLLGIILGNLLDNALKYAAAQSHVTVRMAPEARHGQHGIGFRIVNVPEDTLPDISKMFEKFYRAPAARAQSGSGLGLYIARGVAQLLGGELTAATNHHHVEFTLWLPV